ncbi:ecto-NOX disulfide-thiol exchanger 2 isoform X2 [Pectinophora gossypiella]|nr:ecto-NOX disulfide-thiol exchanger 2 isoform X2 [Pectinophora gossypiella]XP_049874416.1 ecto-NOX disulfide-thiol exchanger 2 isoform X2 [Pectinophora gossypiella]XP_049874417.1 ecto-NOX disulfide-thiol exchanger 2 isoform X2 [Pectinophora gossypiella]XP_049874418.1 ecto-NOX disulfide-thiol exchanger 2 isoform X2 [Pectinophora gossypiella]
MGSGGLGGGGTMASGIMSGGISGNGNGGSVSDIHNNMMNPQMMMTNMYPGNMMMAGGMYPNMMMPNTMMGGGIMPSTGIDMMPSSGMEMIPQPSMDISSMSGQPMQPSGNPSMDLGIMGGMMMDPSMMGNMAMYPNSGGDMPIVQEKKEIILKHCKLTPPNPGMALPPRRSKPPGCRTIFVGGLPDNIRENIVREIFENYGRIHILRLSTKNFCHIRFDREGCVDAAMQISGYNIKLISKESESEEETKANSGWLHVDYALSRDDQNEYERRQRQAMRAQEQQLHQMGAQQQALVSRNMYSGRHRSPSPMRLQPFSNAAIVQLAEKIKSEENFLESLPTLISWLERGECSKKNSNQFYSMIQATNSHIRRLYNEKVQAEDELSECKERIKNTIALVIEQLEQVAKVFAAATHQRVWDHFTKPQRKNIETWQKMSQEFNALKEEFVERFSEENEYNGYNPSRGNEFGNNEEVHKLKLENDSLKFQLEAYKNEVDVIKADAHKELEKFKAQYIARQALQGNFDKNPPLPSPLKKPPPPPPLPDDMDNKINLKETVEVGCGEAKLIGIMSAFLQVHPQGASLDYVVSYVRAMFPNVSQANVHHVLQKHDDVFKRTTSGVGANIEHRWSFIAFQNTEI